MAQTPVISIFFSTVVDNYQFETRNSWHLHLVEQTKYTIKFQALSY